MSNPPQPHTTARAPRPLKPARVGGDVVFEFKPARVADLACAVARDDLVYAPPAMIKPGAHAGAIVPRPPNLDALRAALRRRQLELVACGPMYWRVTRLLRTRGRTP